MRGQEDCWQSSDLALTETQTKALEGLQRDYTIEAIPLRRELMSLRFELRHLIRDPNVQPKVLFDRQKKISDLQVPMQAVVPVLQGRGPVAQAQTEKELPQPQVWVALGLLKLKPPPIRALLKSSCMP